MPESACRRVFTTIDGDQVEIYHECMSGGCAPSASSIMPVPGHPAVGLPRRNLLRERCLSGCEMSLSGSIPHRRSVSRCTSRGRYIRQYIRCIGGPAYSLTDMLSFAEGVCGVTVHREGAVVKGEVTTRALAYVAVGVDDTDTETEGATFALALALLQHLANLDGVMPIGHR